MGQKKDTLLRWVNCCSDAATNIERIKNLADGWFFIHILNFLRSHPTDGTDPWLQTINILREYKLQENVVDFDAAASGNEDELAKLIVICMHLTMVQKPCEHIKEKTMWNLSTEDQKVIEAILLALVNDDQLTRSRLIDVLQDNLQVENSFTKSVMFYTSSPLSSLSSMKNSPLKRFLDSPMALRLTRLQKEISDKNEEIRRLQSELMTESDESSALSLRMDDLKRKVKDLEKKNTELEQRLRDVQLPDSSGPDTDGEITHLKKRLKKMQNEYEASCQKYCDLNIEYEAMKTRQEKDRKQIRKLQLDLNDSVARFEKESAEYQLLLDSIRTENAELKHSLEEKAQWIDVLEEKSRTCSEMHARLNAPRSPCERESIGYSLLSIETEKLQGDLESYRRDLARQSDQFNSEKRIFQQRAAALEEDKRGLHRQVEEANLENQSLHVQLDQAKTSLEQLSLGCDSLSKEKEELRRSLDELQSEFHKEMSRAQQQLDIRIQKTLELGLDIEALNHQLEETQAAKKALEQSIHELTEENLGLGQSMAALEQSHLDLQSTLSTNQSKFQCELEEVSSHLKSSKLQIAGQSLKITELEGQLECLRTELVTKDETFSILETEKQQLCETKLSLEQQMSALQSAFEMSKQEFQARLEKVNTELESATAQIADFCEVTSSLKEQLEVALQDKLQSDNLSSQLEADLNKLCQERDNLQVEVQQLLHAAQVSREEFQAEKDGLLMELEATKNDVIERENRILVAEQKHQEATLQINHLESSVRSLEQETAELIASRSFFDQQISVLRAAVDTGKTALREIEDRAKEEAETHANLITQQKEIIQSLQVRVENLSEEKNVLESQIVDLGADKENLHQQLISLEDSRKEEQAAHDILVAELETLQANSRQLGEVYQQQMVVKSEEIASMEKKLETAVQKEVELEVRIAEVNNEKDLLVRENELLKEEVSELISTIAKEKNVLETNLNVLKGELESNVNAMEQSQQKIQHMELELSGLIANKSSLESEVQKLSAECTVLAEGRLHLEKENSRMDEFYKEQVKEYENRLSRLTEEHSMHVTSMEERLEAAQQINLRIEEVNGEKIRLLQENKLLQEEVSNLTSCITKEKIVFETDFNALKEELESNIKVMEESKQKIQEMELELTEMIAQKSSLESEVEELSAKCSEMAEKRSRLEEENRKMDVSHKEQLAEFERRLSSLTEDNAVRINQLDERLNAVVQLNHQLKDDCTRLESEREAMSFEKSGFEQMYLEVKAACEEAETKIQMEGELARQEVDAKKQQVLQQSNALDELEHMISSLRQDKADAESSYTQQLLLLQAEKQEMMESHDRVEQHNASLLASFEASRNELERQLTDANLKLKDHVELLQQSHLSRQQTEEQMEALEAKVCKLELDLKKAVEEKGQLTNEMMVLQAVQGEMRNLEVAMEQLTSEIQELSFKKANLEKLREVLEEAKATAEEETRQLRRENQELKSELAAEKTKILQGKGEIMLEHRKEKAALEARLLVAQSQMKSMQEKLVNMTVANNSHAPLEHKVSVLTSELEAVNKAKSELEKRLDDSISVRKEEMLSVKKEELTESHLSKASTLDFDSEIAYLRKKYDSAKKELNRKDEVINQYAVKFEKMQNQLDNLNEEVASLNMDKKKLVFENRSLKTEQNHLLAQISSEKDKANARNTRHSLALQRGSAASNGGTLADAMIDARRRSMRPTRSEVVSTSRERQEPIEVFRPPQLAFGDGSDANSIFKVPPSRRDSTSSVCSNRSDVSITSRGTNVPHGAGRLFTCDDEDGELFSSSYLNEMKEGKCRVEDSSTRVSELLRRNTMQPPHMRSAYPIEMNDERLRQNDMTIYDQPKATSSRADNHDTLQQLSFATSMLSMNTPPAMNTRKRRSSSWNPTEMETPVMQPRKRRSYELDADLSSDSTDTRSISSSAERKKHRDASLTSYSRPGPPTPARNAVKENISTPSTASSPPKATSKASSKAGSKRTSPAHGTKNSKLTPVGALVRKVQAKLRSNIQASNEQNTPSSTRTTPRGSKLNIFRKPLGSRTYNSDAKF
ncbi:COP1-interactive protein 1-like isoform X4 [Daphnia pulex]|uniref:COP1-interactive protein 1-like isoform X4 n=1 Tax=Daphnia pulex TaxID=6669 RepID=UPI001EDE3049|nr:COP1-interactive protein 1-like isoform X4 [Daphnia pulex]